LVNTGWSGGAFGVGSRINLRYTRAMITAALNGELNKAEFKQQPVFGFMMPTSCPGVPSEMLDPKNTWQDKEAYDKKAIDLALQFLQNFEKYANGVSKEILEAAPVVKNV
jgi:phosphoenolpyruvate carboxykinase (ATP)